VLTAGSRRSSGRVSTARAYVKNLRLFQAWFSRVMFRVRVWSHADYSKQLNETVVNELLEKFNEFYFGEDSRN